MRIWLRSNRVNGLSCAQLLPSSQGVAGPSLRCVQRASPRKWHCEQLVIGRALCAFLCRLVLLHAAHTHSCWLNCALRYDLLLAHDPLFRLAALIISTLDAWLLLMRGAVLKVRLGAGGATSFQGRLKQGLGE